MENKMVKLKIFQKNGLFEDVNLVYKNWETPFVHLKFEDFDSGIIKGRNIYEAMQLLHAILDKLNMKLMCNCFRYDIRPSGMSIDMSGGIMAYKLVSGIRPTETVNIFEPTDSVDSIVSVEDQQKYFLRWQKSLQ